MTAAVCEPTPKAGAESAEVRKAKRGAGSRAVGECGKSAEKVRNLSISSASVSVLIPSAPVLPAPAPSLVRGRGRARREGFPAQALTTGGDGWPSDAPLSLARGLPAPEQAVIDAALAILARRVREPGAVIDSPGAARELVRLHLAQCERERFGVLFLNGQHGVIGFEVLFEGTLTQTTVHPREVARRALQLNAAAVILAHNHPSGSATPSKADAFLTSAMQHALAAIDVRVLDHLVIGWPGIASMADLGMM